MPISEQVLQAKVYEMNASGNSHRTIAQVYGKPISYGDIGRIIKGVFPKRAEKRIALGLPPRFAVILIGEGTIPDGSQTIRALQCCCGQWFVPNTAKRKKCFICTHFRTRKKKGNQ